MAVIFYIRYADHICESKRYGKDGPGMEKDECWEHFLMSGKVADYLSYRQATKQSDGAPDSGAAVSEAKEPGDKVKKHAGFY